MEGGRGKRIIRMEKSCDECTASLASFLSRRFSSMRLIAILELYENETGPLPHRNSKTNMFRAANRPSHSSGDQLTMKAVDVLSGKTSRREFQRIISLFCRHYHIVQWRRLRLLA